MPPRPCLSLELAQDRTMRIESLKDPKAIATTCDALLTQFILIDLLVLNAGTGSFKETIESTLNERDKQMKKQGPKSYNMMGLVATYQ